jgi:hypothetical protein
MFKKIKRWFQRPQNPAGNVYYAKLTTPQGVFYKLGYTSKSTLAERMAYGSSGDEKLIDTQLLFAYREDAWDVEQTLLEYLDRYRAFGKYSNDPSKPLCGRGQSELFAEDVLGLDDDQYRLDDLTLKATKENQKSGADGCLLTLIGLALAPFTLGFSLLLIAGGLSEIFGQKPVLVFNGRTRPIHSKSIQELIAALRRDSAPCPETGSRT